jgi:hypothetical protein
MHLALTYQTVILSSSSGAKKPKYTLDEWSIRSEREVVHLDLRVQYGDGSSNKSMLVHFYQWNPWNTEIIGMTCTRDHEYTVRQLLLRASRYSYQRWLAEGLEADLWVRTAPCSINPRLRPQSRLKFGSRVEYYCISHNTVDESSFLQSTRPCMVLFLQSWITLHLDYGMKPCQ